MQHFLYKPKYSSFGYIKHLVFFTHSITQVPEFNILHQFSKSRTDFSQHEFEASCIFKKFTYVTTPGVSKIRPGG